MIVIRQNSLGQRVQPTIFPDGTSQVWQLNLAAFESAPVNIVWHFEQEAELIWVNQLIRLLEVSHIKVDELFIPYLPYARQDKAISNTSTFAKQIFLEMLLVSKVGKVTTLDAHSNDDRVISYSAARYIAQAMQAAKPNVLVFPDASAYSRYAQCIDTQNIDIVVLDKVRHQTTGEITGLVLDQKNTSASLRTVNKTTTYHMLIIDDICDGGATFINAAMYLHHQYQCQLSLYVTHGIFSKGFEKLIAAGITNFYTTQSLSKNTIGFALEELKNDL